MANTKTKTTKADKGLLEKPEKIDTSLDSNLDDVFEDDTELQSEMPKLPETYTPPSVLYIPEEAKRKFASEGYSLHWVRVNAPGSVSGELDMVNIQRQQEDGYEFIERKDVPGLKNKNTSYFAKEFAESDNGLYKVGDLALAKIKTERLVAKKRYFEGQTRERAKSIITDLRQQAIGAGLKKGNTKEVIDFGEEYVHEKGTKASRRGFGE